MNRIGDIFDPTPETPDTSGNGPTILHRPGSDPAPHELNRSMGWGWNFAGLESRNKIFEWSPIWSQWDFDQLASHGAGHVRIPAKFSKYWNGRGFESEFAQWVNNAVSWAREAGLIAVLDIHHYSEMDANPAAEEDKFVAMWRVIAEAFEHVPPEALILELVNEPKNQLEDLETLVRIQRRALKEIRAVSPERVVMYGAYYNSPWSTLEHPVLDDGPLIVSVHDYLPLNFTHQQLPWTDEPHPPRGWPHDGEQDEHIALLEDIAAWEKTHGIPVNIGEYGAVRYCPEPDRSRYLAWLDDQYDRLGFSKTFWDAFTNEWHAAKGKPGDWTI
jgi:endoglucanase